MWTRKELKNRAKVVLRENYWQALIVSIIIAIVGGNEGRVWSNWGSGSNSTNSKTNTYSTSHQASSVDWHAILIAILIFMAIAAVIVAIVLGFRILIGYSLEVGGRRYFIQSAQKKYNTNWFLFGFDRQNYVEIIKTMLLRSVYNFLWYCLLFIPGIIKSYAYRMVPYILADNPSIGAKKAIDISNKMTKGHKFDMFVLDLSFIAWYLFGLIFLLVGIVFVWPYENATKAELYLTLRKNALDNNWCSYDDLLLIQPNLDDKSI